MLLLLFVITIVLFLIWHNKPTVTGAIITGTDFVGDNSAKPNNRDNMAKPVKKPTFGDFAKDKANIETKVQSCRTAVKHIANGTEKIKSEFLRVKTQEFSDCKLDFTKNVELYKKTYRDVTGKDVPDSDMRKIISESGADFY
jgi:hypothetical protein